MDPGHDPALAARFLGWLQRQHGASAAEGLSGAIARLTDLRAWHLSPGGLEALPLAPEEREPCLRVAGAWRAFRETIPADWIEGARDDDGVLWVDAAALRERRAPAGEAPHLMRSGGGDAAPASRRQPPRALIPLLVAGALVVALVGLELSSRLALARAATELSSEPLRREVEFERRVRRSTRSETLQFLWDLRVAQRLAVNSACEGGAWCEARLREIDRALRAVAAARPTASHPPAGIAPATARGPRYLEIVNEARGARDELAALAGTDLTSTEAASRRASLEAELAVFAAHGHAP